MTEAGEDDLLTSDAVSVGDIKAGGRPRAVELWEAPLKRAWPEGASASSALAWSRDEPAPLNPQSTAGRCW